MTKKKSPKKSKRTRPAPSPPPPSSYALLQTIHANQLVMIGMLQSLQKQESKMALDLTALTAEVANNTSVDASVEQLVTNLAQQIANMPPSSDPATQAALDALVATLQNNDAAIAAAVLQNTPAAPPAPAPASGRR